MHCPRCGEVLVPSGETLKCTSGEMELSDELRRRLVEVFVSQSRTGKSLPMNWGGAWYCPGCGVPTVADAGHIRCSHCGELLDEFLHVLIELHPHR
jgi:uncharacterized Zn finger protein (UPF0148 family)